MGVQPEMHLVQAAVAADKVWLYITILGSSYMISRGLAKAGSREPYYSDGTNSERGDHDADGTTR